MIRDVPSSNVLQCVWRLSACVLYQARKAEVAVLVQEKLLDGIVGTSEDETFIKSMRLALAEGEMEDNKIDVTVSSRSNGTDKSSSSISVDNSVSGFEIFKISKDGKGGKKGEKKKMTVAEARPIIEESEIERLMDEHDIPKEAIAAVEVCVCVCVCVRTSVCEYECVWV